MPYRLTLSILFLLFYLHSFSQFPHYLQYNTSNDLSTNQVYELHEDSKGYIWALSDNGIYRFDGTKFHEINCTVSTSIPIDIAEKNEVIVICFLDGKVGYYDYQEHRILAHPMNDHIWNEAGKMDNTVLNNSLKIDENGLIFLSCYSGGFKIIGQDTVLSFLTEEKKNRLTYTNTLENPIYTTVRTPGNAEQNFEMYVNDSVINIPDSFVITRTGGGRDFVKTINGADFLIEGDRILRFEGGKISAGRCFQVPINNIAQLTKNELIVFGENKGPLIVDFNTLRTINNDHQFPFKSITSCIKDSEGGIWYSTLFDGIIYVPVAETSCYSPSFTSGISALYKKDKRVYFGSKNGHIGYMTGNTLKEMNHPSTGKVIGFATVNEKLICVTQNSLLEFNNEKFTDRFKVVYDKLQFSMGSKDFFVKNDSIFIANIIGTHLVLGNKIYNSSHLLISDTKYFPIPVNNIRKQRFYSTCNVNNIFFASHKNYILTYDPLNLNNIDTVYKHTDKIKKIAPGPGENGLLFCSKKAAFYLNAVNNEAICIDEMSGFINTFNLKDSVLWTGTSSGLSKTVYDPTNDKFETENFLSDFAYKNGGIQSILIENDTLYAGTSGAILKMSVAQLQHEPKQIRIHNFRVMNEGKEIIGKNKHQFDYKSNSFTFHFDIPITKNRSDLKIYYRLNENQNWLLSQQNQIEVPFLQPGDYNFQTKACFRGNCSEIHSYPLTITPPFWESWKFRGSAITLLILILIIIYSLRIRKIEKEKEILKLEQHMRTLHQQALKAQLNPHFIFNALASIQGFISTNNLPKSEKYLTDFSHLMRLVLESSTDQFISIDKELKLLNSYLSLEQLRLGFSFDFTINVSPTLFKLNFKIPTMILQPIVENAVQHGIFSVENGRIELNMYSSEDSVTCEIRDNGNGIVASDNRKEYTPKSSGILEERLQLLQKDYKTGKISYSNLSSGTLVKVQLPIKN